MQYYNLKYKQIYDKLKEAMTKDGKIHPRFQHSLNVAEMALYLNDLFSFQIEKDKVYLAGLLHDCAKLISKEELWKIIDNNCSFNKVELKNVPSIWHGFAGKFIANKEYGIKDEEILSAIFYHTTGKPNMTNLEMLIFVSDYIEKGRIGSCFDLARKVCYNNLELGAITILKQTIEYLKEKNYPIFSLTLDTLDYYMRKERLINA